MDVNMEDTIIVRPYGALQRTNQERDLVRIVEVEDSDEKYHNALDTPMEDTTTVRGERTVQNVNENRALAHSEAEFTLSKEQYVYLNELGDRVEQLLQEASFTSEWREKAEGDYVRTRDRVTESEQNFSKAIATANQAGQLALTMEPKISQLEMELSSKQNQIQHLSEALAATHTTLNAADISVSNLTARIQQLESNKVEVENNIQLQEARFIEKLSQLNTKWETALSTIVDKVEREAKTTVTQATRYCDDLHDELEESKDAITKLNKKLSLEIAARKELEQPKPPTPKLRDYRYTALANHGDSFVDSNAQTNIGGADHGSIFPGSLPTQVFNHLSQTNENECNVEWHEKESTTETDPIISSPLLSQQGKNKRKVRLVQLLKRSQNNDEPKPMQSKQQSQLESIAKETNSYSQVVKNGEKCPSKFEEKKDIPGATTKPLSLKEESNLTGEDRRILVSRNPKMTYPHSKANNEIASAVNRALAASNVPFFARIHQVYRNGDRSIVLITSSGISAKSLLEKHHNIIVNAARTVDKGVEKAAVDLAWCKLKVDGVPYQNYLGKGTDGLIKFKQEIESENEGVVIPLQIRWFGRVIDHKERAKKGEKRASSVTLMVKGKKVAARLVEKGFRAAGRQYAATHYEEQGPDSLCGNCSRWGHIALKCPTPNTPTCAFCAKGHSSEEHMCKYVGCTALKGCSCPHIERKCVNCRGNHYASFKGCPEKRKAVDEAKCLRRSFLERKRDVGGLLPPKNSRSRAWPTPLSTSNYGEDIEVKTIEQLATSAGSGKEKLITS